MKAISKTKVKRHLRLKTNPYIQETIRFALAHKPWTPLAKLLASGTRLQVSINLDQIDQQTKEGDTVIVPGKVLSIGELTKKVRIAALGFSKSAKEKMKKNKSEAVTILDEMKINSKAEGVRILR